MGSWLLATAQAAGGASWQAPAWLRYVLDFQWTHGMPMGTARALFMVFFLVVALFGVLQSRRYVYAGAESQARWRDLRLWVVVIMALQAGIYLVF
jgi:hypothetical protein